MCKPSATPQTIVRTAGSVRQGDWMYDAYTETKPVLVTGAETDPNNDQRVYITRKDKPEWRAPYNRDEWVHVLTPQARTAWQLAEQLDHAADVEEAILGSHGVTMTERGVARKNGKVSAFRQAAALARNFDPPVLKAAGYSG